MSQVNFLPWRRQRQTRCLRLWGTLFAGSILVVVAVVISLRSHCGLLLQGQQHDLAGTTAVQRALEERQKALQQRQTRTPPRQKQVWSPVLASLAQALPAQAWLTQLRYQPPSLVLTGYAATLPALTEMANALTQVTGFTPGPPGELQQDSQGRWMFTFRLDHRG